MPKLEIVKSMSKPKDGWFIIGKQLAIRLSLSTQIVYIANAKNVHQWAMDNGHWANRKWIYCDWVLFLIHINCGREPVVGEGARAVADNGNNLPWIQMVNYTEMRISWLYTIYSCGYHLNQLPLVWEIKDLKYYAFSRFFFRFETFRRYIQWINHRICEIHYHIVHNILIHIDIAILGIFRWYI